MTFEDLLNDEPYKSCYQKGFADGKAKGRADVIDELLSRIDDEYCDGGYGDYHEVEMIVRMIQQLKEQKNE